MFVLHQEVGCITKFPALTPSAVILNLAELLDVSWSRKTECGINQFLTPHPLRVVLELAGEAGGVKGEP